MIARVERGISASCRDGHAGSVCSPEPTNTTAPQSVALPANDPRDLTPGDLDVSPFHLGGQEMYAISTDGQELASAEYVTLLHERHVR